MPVFLVICYPLLVHLSVIYDQPLLQAMALTCLAMAFSLSGLLRGNIYLWLMLLAVCGGSISLALMDAALYLLYVPPIALPLLLFVVFASTLMPGKEALVTAIGEASRGPLGTKMRRYTRVVTAVWAGIFLLMVLVASLLPLTGNQVLWSWVTSIWNYVVVAVFFVGEFWLRQWLFPDHDHPGFIEYIKIVVAANVSRR